MKKTLIVLSLMASATGAHAALPCAKQVEQAVEKSAAEVSITGIEVNRKGTLYRVGYIFDGGDFQTRGHWIIAVNPANLAVSDPKTWKDMK